MTIRDPYTGVETRAPRPPRSFVSRWWPVALFVAIAVVGGGAEWRNSTLSRAPHPTAAASTPQPARGGTAVGSAKASLAEVPPAGSATTTPSLGNSDLIASLDALTAASDRLSNDALLLIIVAALQAIVLVCQLYLFGKQLQAARDRPK